MDKADKILGCILGGEGVRIALTNKRLARYGTGLENKSEKSTMTSNGSEGIN